MKTRPNTQGPEVICISSMGNEPGLNARGMLLTPQARALKKREIENEKDPAKKRQLLRALQGGSASKKQAASNWRAQVADMRAAAGKKQKPAAHDWRSQVADMRATAGKRK